MNDALQVFDFPPASRDEWQRRALGVLKGKALETLYSRTADGIIIEPLYEPVSAGAIETGAEGEPWSILQRVDHPEPIQGNALALDDVKNGATGLVLTFSGTQSARGFGLRAPNAPSIGMALKDIPLHAVDLRLEAGSNGLTAAEAMRHVVIMRGLNPERINLSFGIDPIGAFAAQGRLGQSWSDLSNPLAALTASLAQEFAGPFVEADGRIYHDGGGSEAQELGCALAAAVSYLRLFEGKLTDAVLARLIGVTLATDTDIFLTIAKFRAARLLWRQMLKTCGLPEARLRLHGETSWRMMTRQDAQGNLLRNVAAVFAAGLGGADSFCALPFSLAQGLPDQFARRMARNVQIILIEESNLHRVADPAKGSGYVDHLTSSLAEKAWEFFQDIEMHGGMVEALEKGFVQDKIRQSKHQRMREIASGKHVIIGVTTFAKMPEVSPSILAIEPKPPTVLTMEAIQAKRDAEEFESAPGVKAHAHS
jgi:methylmalonyl-CoA mutase